MKQNCSFRGHCPLCARRRFIGALVPEAPLDHYGLGLTKPTTFLRLWSFGHEKSANDNRRHPSSHQQCTIVAHFLYVRQMAAHLIWVFSLF